MKPGANQFVTPPPNFATAPLTEDLSENLESWDDRIPVILLSGSREQFSKLRRLTGIFLKRLYSKKLGKCVYLKLKLPTTVGLVT